MYNFFFFFTVNRKDVYIYLWMTLSSFVDYDILHTCKVSLIRGATEVDNLKTTYA